MTPRERVEAVARVAWGVPDVRVEVFPDHRHPARVVASALVYSHDVDGIPTGFPCATAWDATEAAALMRLADQMVAEPLRTAERTRAHADALATEARILEGLVRCIALAVPCRDHAARCIGTHPPREFCPVVILRRAAWGLHGWREAADLARRCRAAGTGWPFAETVTRQPWWRPAGARGRACRDPRRRSAVCPACPARIPLDTRPAL